MSEHTYKMIELVGSSHTGIEAAVQNAIAKAEISESKMRWFEVMETRGHIENGKIAHRQVSGADPEDPDTPRRTARAASNLVGPWPAHRLGRDCPSPRRPGNPSSDG